MGLGVRNSERALHGYDTSARIIAGKGLEISE